MGGVWWPPSRGPVPLSDSKDVGSGYCHLSQSGRLAASGQPATHQPASHTAQDTAGLKSGRPELWLALRRRESSGHGLLQLCARGGLTETRIHTCTHSHTAHTRLLIQGPQNTLCDHQTPSCARQIERQPGGKWMHSMTSLWLLIVGEDPGGSETAQGGHQRTPSHECWPEV